MRNFHIQEQVKKAFCYQKLFWPFTLWIDCSSDQEKLFKFKTEGRELAKKILTVGENNFGKYTIIFWQHINSDFVPICCFFLHLQKLVVLDRIFFEAFFLIPCHETKDDFIRFKLLLTHFLWRCLTAAKVLVWLLGRILDWRLDPNPEQD